MATAEEVIATMAEGAWETLPEFVIDSDMRVIDTNAEKFIFGVAGDDDVNRVRFVMPRKYRGVDLSTFEIRINYVNASGEKGVYKVKDAAFDDEQIQFTWLVDRHTLEAKGEVKFVVCLRDIANKITMRELNTTLASGIVLEGLEPDEEPEEPADDPDDPDVPDEPDEPTIDMEDYEPKAAFETVKLPPVEQYGAVGYANGKYIAHATSGMAAYSEDGINWTQTEKLPTNNVASAFAYGNGVYVAAHLGCMIYSTDGITWTEGTTPATAAWADVVYGNGKFFAGSWDGYFISSEDGITWTQVGSKYGYFVGNPCNIDYGNGTFVITGSSMGELTIMAYSTDGVTWEYGSHLNGIKGGVVTCYGDGKFVTLGYGGGAYSVDGINWTGINLPFDPDGWTSVCYGNGVYIGICPGKRYYYADDIIPHPNISKAIYSTDGINWSEISMPSEQKWMSVCYGDNGFVAISERGVAAHSTDGIHWTESELPITSTSFYGHFSGTRCACGDGLYMVVDGITKKELWSLDGRYWSVAALSDVNSTESLCYGSGKFVGVFYALDSATNKYVYKTAYTLRRSGTYWTMGNALSTHAQLCYGMGKFVAVGTGVAWYSADGITWTETALPSTGECKSVCYGRGCFVAIFSDNTAAYSTDGINWTAATLPETTERWLSVCYGKNMFVAVASGNVAAYSGSGSSWTATTQPVVWKTSKTVCYGNGKFIAVGFDYDDVTYEPTESSVCVYSEDGINWVESTVPSSHWLDMCYCDGKFVAICGDTLTDDYGIAVCDVTKPLK